MLKSSSMLAVLFISVIFYTGGCLFPKNHYTPIKYYGLQVTRQKTPVSTMLKIGSIASVGITSPKMTFQTGQCQILIDEYHRWINVPAVMITTALQNSFSGIEEKNSFNKKKSTYTLTGTIFKFIADVDNKTTTLGITYRISNAQGKFIEDSVTFNIPVKKVDAESYALAMSKAVEKLAERINRTITHNPM